MRIAPNTVATFEYTVVDDKGELIESSQDAEPMSYLHGAGRIAPGLEAAMEGKTVGDTFSVTLSPEQAFGHRDDSKVLELPKREVARLGEIRIGMQLEARDSSGRRILTVTEIGGDKVTLDENHPLAGKTLSFDVTVTDVREATADELGLDSLHDVRCAEDCGTCDLHSPLFGQHDCGCGCDHHH